MAVFLSKT